MEKGNNIWSTEERGTEKEERNHSFGEGKLMVTSTDQPTNRPTGRVNIEQSAFSKVRKWKKGRELQFITKTSFQNWKLEVIILLFKPSRNHPDFV